MMGSKPGRKYINWKKDQVMKFFRAHQYFLFMTDKRPPLGSKAATISRAASEWMTVFVPWAASYIRETQEGKVLTRHIVNERIERAVRYENENPSVNKASLPYRDVAYHYAEQRKPCQRAEIVEILDKITRGERLNFAPAVAEIYIADFDEHQSRTKIGITYKGVDRRLPALKKEYGGWGLTGIFAAFQMREAYARQVEHAFKQLHADKLVTPDRLEMFNLSPEELLNQVTQFLLKQEIEARVSW